MRVLSIILCSMCVILLGLNPTFAKSVKFAVVSDVNYNIATDKNNKNYAKNIENEDKT